MTLYYDGYAGAIATLDGTTVTVAACSSAYVPSASDVDLDAIAAGEIDTGDAAGYTRQTVGVTWDVATRRLTFDDPIEFDLDGASDVQHFVVADASGDLAFVLSYDTPIEGYDGFILAPPVAASEADTAGIEARLLALETAPGPASPVPDPSEAPDGQVIVTFDGGYVLDEGGVESVVAGTGITVDDTDPASPIISATGGGGGAVMLPPPLDLSADGSSYVEADLTGLAVDEASRAIIVSETTDMVEVYLPEVVDDFPPEPDGDGRVIAARGPVHIFANGSISHEFDLVIGGLTVRSVQGRASATLWPCWSGLNLYEWKADTDATGDGGGGAYNTTPEVNTVGDEEDGALLIDASGIDPSVRSVAYLIADTVTSISVQMPDHETRGRLALAFYAANPVTVTVSLGAGPVESFDATNLMTIDADYVEIAGWAMWLPFGTWSL